MHSDAPRAAPWPLGPILWMGVGAGCGLGPQEEGPHCEGHRDIPFAHTGGRAASVDKWLWSSLDGPTSSHHLPNRYFKVLCIVIFFF